MGYAIRKENVIFAKKIRNPMIEPTNELYK